MRKTKRALRKIPGVASTYRLAKRIAGKLLGKKRDPQSVFTEIFEKDKWQGHASISGRGSDDDQTMVLVEGLGEVFRQLGIRSMLDAPCGDFHWMQRVDRNTIDYTGGDIVAELIAQCQAKYGREGVKFRQLNLITDQLPKVDLVFCRDCIVHLSFADGLGAMRNICASGSTYLLSTSYPHRSSNDDILTGDWRTLNLQMKPFAFPKPIMTIDERCTEADGEYADKCLCLWRIEDIARALNVAHGAKSTSGV